MVNDDAREADADADGGRGLGGQEIFAYRYTRVQRHSNRVRNSLKTRGSGYLPPRCLNSTRFGLSLSPFKGVAIPFP